MREPQATAADPASTTCPLCGGSGFQMVEAKDSKGRPIQRATKCECAIRARGQRLIESARIPERYQHCDLANFETQLGGRGTELLTRAKMVAEGFVREYPDEKRGLLLTGPIGVGKTHLAIGIIKELMIQKGVPCLFYDYRELLRELRNSYNASVPITEMDVLRPVLEVEVLVFDEVGVSNKTEWVGEVVSHILNMRYNDNATTILTTNYPDEPSLLEEEALRSKVYTQNERARRAETLGDRIGDRMRSRLHEMCKIVKLDGDDFRIKYKNGSFH